MAEEHTAESLHAAAAKLGAKGGARGGPARAKSLTPARRKAIAMMGHRARAAKNKGPGK